MVITKTIKMELSEQRQQVVDVMQNDACTRALAFRLHANGKKWQIPEGISAAVSYRKPDGTVGLYDTLPDGTPAVALAGNVATAVLAEQALTVAGKVDLSVVLQDGRGKRLATFGVALLVHPDPAAGKTESDNYISLYAYMPQPANGAAVGQYLEIEEVSESGRITKVKAVPAPACSGGTGADGQDGITPHIGDNGNWWIGETDTGVQAKGQDGVTPSFRIGVVETLEAGSNATASISGTEESPVLNLGIPKGADGKGGAGDGGASGWTHIDTIDLSSGALSYEFDTAGYTELMLVNKTAVNCSGSVVNWKSASSPLTGGNLAINKVVGTVFMLHYLGNGTIAYSNGRQSDTLLMAGAVNVNESTLNNILRLTFTSVTSGTIFIAGRA